MSIFTGSRAIAKNANYVYSDLFFKVFSRKEF